MPKKSFFLTTFPSGPTVVCPDPATEAAPWRLEHALRLSSFHEVASRSVEVAAAAAAAAVEPPLLEAALDVADCRLSRRWCRRPPPPPEVAAEATEDAEDVVGGGWAEAEAGVPRGDCRKG